MNIDTGAVVTAESGIMDKCFSPVSRFRTYIVLWG